MNARVEAMLGALRRELAQAKAERDQAVAEAAAVIDVLGIISSAPGDLVAVFEAILEKAHRLGGASRGTLFLFDGETFRAAAAHGYPEGLGERPRAITIAEDPRLAALVAGETLIHVPDLTQLDDPIARAVAARGGVRTNLLLPLRKDGTLLGVLSCNRTEVRPFTDKQIALLQNFAAQAVIAIENARLLTETREALAQQTATAEVLQVINASPGDLQPVFAAMVEKARHLCDADSGHLALPIGSDFRTAAVSAVSPEMEAVIRAVSYAAGRGTAIGRALMQRQAVQIADIGADTEHAARHAAARGMIRTILGVPLLREGEPIGAFGLSRSRVEPFTDRQIALVRTFAAQAVIAIENARLLGDLRERTDDLQESLEYQTATSDVLRIIASAPDHLRPIFEAMLDNATRLCGVEAGNLYLYGDGILTPVAARHPDPKIVAEILGNPLRPGPATATARVVASKAPVHIPDAADDDLYRAGDPFRVRMVERVGVRGLLGVPLLRGDEVVGTIMIYRPLPGPFSERQIELVRTFADQAAIAIENARLITETREARDQAEASLRELKAAQANLIQAEKMASLGQLTAGIAHEIKNPLNFINNFAALSNELLDEIKEIAAPAIAALDAGKRAELDETLAVLSGNLDKIAEHGNRADGIVKSMLAHSRGSSGERQPVDLNALVDESLNLAYHGARAHDPGFNITLERDFDAVLKPLELVPQDITRVFLNLFGNGFYAAAKRARENGGGSFRPVLTVRTREAGDLAEVTVRDNGTGIPPEIRDRLFQPFFTTKPTGEGTGLGLSISYDIVTQQHGGTISVDSEPGSYTEFTVRLPRRR